MKRITIVTAAVAALALASTPAFADNNKDKGKATGLSKQVYIEVHGTVASLVDSSTVTLRVKAASQPKALKALTKILRDATITVKSDSMTVVKRDGATVLLSALMVGDKLNLRAKCVAGTPIVCTATRITASSVKLHLGLEVRGVVVSNAAGVLGVVVLAAKAGDDLTLRERALLGTTMSFLTDTTTVVTKAGATVTVASLTGFPAVNLEATCTTATPAVCTAKRITVIVPTA